MKQGLVSITHSAYGVGMGGSGAMHVGCDVMKCGLSPYDSASCVDSIEFSLCESSGNPNMKLVCYDFFTKARIPIRRKNITQC